MADKDDAAPPTGGPDDETPNPPSGEPPAPVEAPAESTAHEEGEKVPEWGKTLISQVESLTAAVTAGSEEHLNPPEIDDANPSPKPWHKKGGK